MAKKTNVKWKYLKMNGKLDRGFKVSNYGDILDTATGEELMQYDMAKKSAKNGTDYKAVYLYGGPHRVHRIVCETFNGKQPKNKPWVRHLDGRKNNNKAGNVAWASPSETTLHSHKMNNYIRFSLNTIKRVKRLINKGETNEDIATVVSMSDSNVSAIKYGYIHIGVEPLTEEQLELGNVA